MSAADELIEAFDDDDRFAQAMDDYETDYAEIIIDLVFMIKCQSLNSDSKETRMNPLKHLYPFYDLGRKFGFRLRDIDDALANGATATLDGRIVTLTYDGQVATGRTKLGRTGRATRWVRQFNAKAQRHAEG